MVEAGRIYQPNIWGDDVSGEITLTDIELANLEAMRHGPASFKMRGILSDGQHAAAMAINSLFLKGLCNAAGRGRRGDTAFALTPRGVAALAARGVSSGA